MHYLALALVKTGRPADAIEEYRLALRTGPDLVGAASGLAWVLATEERPELRDGEEAVRLAERASGLTRLSGSPPSMIGSGPSMALLR